MKITKDINVHNGKRNNISIFDLFDDVIKSAFNINDAEYDFIAEKASDEDLNILLIEEPTFQQRRKMIEIRTKYLQQYNEQRA